MARGKGRGGIGGGKGVDERGNEGEGGRKYQMCPKAGLLALGRLVYSWHKHRLSEGPPLPQVPASGNLLSILASVHHVF